MELRRGYKQTEVGVIPEDWEAVPARDLGEFRGGNGFPLRYQGSKSGKLPLYKVSDMNNEGNETLMISSNNWISEEVRQALGAKVFPKGSLVFAKVGAAVFLERKKILAQPSCLDNNMAAFTLDHKRADFQFIHKVLLSRKLGDLVATTALPALNNKQLGEIVLPCPPVPEQRIIAMALSDVDAALLGLSRLLAKKRSLKQAVMQQLLTGRTRLPGYVGEWKCRSLGEIGEVSGAGVDKKKRPSETPVRLLNYMDVYRHDVITSEVIRQEVTARDAQVRRCAVRAGDVFFTPTSEVREDIGHAAVAAEDVPGAVYSYHLVRLRLHEEWDLRFRAYAFQTRRFLDQASTACEGSGTRYVITLPKFRALTVEYPVDQQEQHAIANILSDMDAEIAVLGLQATKTRALKQAMMQALLTGRVRLPIPTPEDALA